MMLLFLLLKTIKHGTFQGHQAWNLPLATKQDDSPLASKHWIHFNGHQTLNLPLATKLRFSFTSFFPFLFKIGSFFFLSFRPWFSVWIFENLFLQLFLGREKWIVLIDGGKMDNKLDDNNTFERMEMSKGRFGAQNLKEIS